MTGLRLKRYLPVVLDMFILMASVCVAYLLRFEFRIRVEDWSVMIAFSVIYCVLMMPWLIVNRIYRRIWSYASVGDMFSISRGIAQGTFIVWSVALVFYLVLERYTVPRSILLMAPIFSFLGIAGARFIWRLMHDGYVKHKDERRRVLIVGAGEAGFIVARELKSERSRYYPAAFIDDNLNKKNLNLAGIPVVGNRYDIPEIVDKLGIQEIIIALPSAERSEITKIINICKTTNRVIKIIPSVNDLVNGRFTISRLRNVDVEDLLGRDPVTVDLSSIADYIKDRVVMVTGAGGSIGSELCRQIVNFQPKTLLLVGRGENSIYEIETELRVKLRDKPIQLHAVIADIQDARRLKHLFETYHPQVVFHAAAHKHVPLMELQPVEAVKNNILGTWNLVEFAHQYAVERFVMISTDKAVNPTNVMGASKRAAEMIVQSKNSVSSTLFATVRFGNVLGSRGSVIPLFRKQIEAGGPVTVTHPDMMRYFMTIPEAVQLVVQAGALSEGGETFVLDMGEPVKIVDLARDLIRLSGFTEKEIPIQFSGARPGEKLFEELLTREEGTRSTVHNRIFIARSEHLSEAEVSEMVASFREIVDRQDTVTPMEVKQLLKHWVPSYVIQETPPPLPTFTLKESNTAEHEYAKMEVAATLK